MKLFQVTNLVPLTAIMMAAQFMVGHGNFQEEENEEEILEESKRKVENHSYIVEC